MTVLKLSTFSSCPVFKLYTYIHIYHIHTYQDHIYHIYIICITFECSYYLYQSISVTVEFTYMSEYVFKISPSWQYGSISFTGFPLYNNDIVYLYILLLADTYIVSNFPLLQTIYWIYMYWSKCAYICAFLLDICLEVKFLYYKHTLNFNHNKNFSPNCIWKVMLPQDVFEKLFFKTWYCVL